MLYEFEYALIRKTEEVRGETGYNGVPSDLFSDLVFCQSSALWRSEQGRGEVTTLNPEYVIFIPLTPLLRADMVHVNYC